MLCKAHWSHAACLHVQHNLYVRRSYGVTDEDVGRSRSPSWLQDSPQSAPQANLVVCTSARVKNAQEAAPGARYLKCSSQILTNNESV